MVVTAALVVVIVIIRKNGDDYFRQCPSGNSNNFNDHEDKITVNFKF